MRSWSVRRINNAVGKLDKARMENKLNPPDGSDGAPFELCEATRDDWSRYVQSGRQALASRWMAWWDNRVFIVELSGTLHENLVKGVRKAITEATGTSDTHLDHYGAAYVGRRPTLPNDINDLLANLEPDASFGPSSYLPGVDLPEDLPGKTFTR